MAISLKNQIAIIPIEGTITTSEQFSIPFSGKTASSSTITNLIKQAIKRKNVKGIILEINSPGGTVIASKEIADEVKKSEKPVVSFIREIGTSGAYWIASASDKIIADPLSITGSIGVISSYLEFSDFLKDWGISYETIKTGEYKDISSPFKKLTQKERKILQKKLNLVHEEFVNEISINRNISKEKLKDLASGIYYLGKEAHEIGLIDYLGNKDLAVNITKELANIKEASLVRYEEEKGILDIFTKISALSSFYIGRGIASELIFISQNKNILPS